jgi:plasmid stabilization system protein ParE
MSIRHTTRARREIRQAAQWWQENRRDAADVFERELRRAFYLLLAHPHVGQPVAHLENVRRLHLSRIRYFLYYRVRGMRS